MRVWLVQLGEPLPDEGGARLYRCGLLAGRLADAGHAVTWWTSAFSHQRKQFRAPEHATRHIRPNYLIELLHSSGYSANASLARLRFHREIVRAFRERSACAERPDVVMAGFPVPALAAAAVDYGRRHGVPVLVDIRDLWPDVFLDLAPRGTSALASLAASGARRRNRALFRAADGIVAISQRYLDWALAQAGRSAHALDRVVFMGYPALQIDASARAAAHASWLQRGVDPDAFVCCFFGTINRHFDLATVLKAAAALDGRAPRFQFVLCGEGAHLKRHRAAAASLGNVLMPGWVDAAHIAALMDLAHAGLAPYAAGARMSLPNKPFEYFSGGLPVVSSLGGELAELLEDTTSGVTYRAGSAADLCTALLTLAADEPSRRVMASTARRLFGERYSSAHASLALMQHLERAASANGRVRAELP